MTEKILQQAMMNALNIDRDLSQWFLSSVNLSHLAVADFQATDDLDKWGFDTTPGMFSIADNRGTKVALHILPILRELGDGMGKHAISRANAMKKINAPEPHDDHRVILVAPASLVRHHWHAAREFPYWIDFDIFTKRQIERCAA